MKNFFVKIGVTFVSLIALLGVNINTSSATVSPTNTNASELKTTIVNEVTESTPLFLYHANLLDETNNDLLAWHYSHQSHESHYSHQSHYSHYSSRW